MTAATGLVLLFLLLSAHLLGDFVLQSRAWIEQRYRNRWRAPVLYGHALIHFALALAVLLLFIDPLAAWGCAAVIGLSHWLIDAIKSYADPDRLLWFVIDQLSHLTVIGLIWFWLSGPVTAQVLWPAYNLAGYGVAKLLMVLFAYGLILSPVSILIGMICRGWSVQISNTGSLPKAGASIGRLERFLVLTFILVDQFAAIGFLLAAKSVLRFGDIKEAEHRKINEYILLGTLLSFAMTIAIGLMLSYGLAALPSD